MLYDKIQKNQDIVTIKSKESFAKKDGKTPFGKIRRSQVGLPALSCLDDLLVQKHISVQQLRCAFAYRKLLQEVRVSICAPCVIKSSLAKCAPGPSFRFTVEESKRIEEKNKFVLKLWRMLSVLTGRLNHFGKETLNTIILNDRKSPECLEGSLYPAVTHQILNNIAKVMLPYKKNIYEHLGISL